MLFHHTCILGDEYHQYDYFVYPKLKIERRHNVIYLVLATVKGWLFSKQDDGKLEKVALPSNDEMMTQCLLFYLEPFKDVLLNDRVYHKEFKIHEFVRKIRFLLQQHKEPFLKDSNHTTIPVPIKSITQVS